MSLQSGERYSSTLTTKAVLLRIDSFYVLVAFKLFMRALVSSHLIMVCCVTVKLKSPIRLVLILYAVANVIIRLGVM